MAGVAGMKRLRSSEHAVANGAAAASSTGRVARLPVPARERRHERVVDSSTSVAGVSVIGSSPERASPVEWRGRDRREAELCWWRWMLLFLIGRVS